MFKEIKKGNDHKVLEIHTYELEDNFILEVQKIQKDNTSIGFGGEEWESYLFHKWYGIKIFVLGYKGSETLEEFLNGVEVMLYDPDLPETFQEDYFQQIEALEEFNTNRFNELA